MIRADWLLVLLTVLAIARLTRLVTTDVVFQPFRLWIIRHRPAPPPQIHWGKVGDVEVPVELPQDEPRDEDWLVYLVHCRWCASVWISAPVAAVVYNWPTSWPVQIGLVALTGSLIAGLAAGLES